MTKTETKTKTKKLTLTGETPTPYSDGEARILARFLGRALAAPTNIARAAARGTFAVL